ncbi:calmodulin binding protein, putative [Ricinus communis]|uniref:Calmodulin binding protein, putative n=1 Tax=Ricinus communis TaxID=3988 RepID=B9T1E0_RICCO|nr:calmodulin binding protein, putative [Ricinus communis]|eukprot:XP_002532059.1 IQ domain-containing protein IQM2 [Ricinus communis]
MGILFSCPFAEYGDFENALESVTVKSISFDHEAKTPARSISFGSQDLEPLILKSLGSGKMIVERSVSFKGGELEKMMSRRDPASDKEKDATSVSEYTTESDSESQNLNSDIQMIQKSQIFDPSNPKHQAAVKLQKVYKSFRTRRKLADCAVLVEQSWWKLLDFAELKHSSISFFDIEKHETAISRWSRARTRAAKVGKGLSKNDKAQKLALQHWLEAIDPRHRYGHNLHFYYVNWLHSKSREPFFYWLDIGEGKEVNLEKCPRLKLQQQCIKYLGPMERKCYEVVVDEGKFIYKQTGEILHTTSDAKWIFVLSTSKTLYVGKKKKGTFQHSSFLAGGVTTAAGRLIVESGILKAVWPHSGHYRPTEENFKDFLSFLRENNVDLTDVKTNPIDEEDGSDKPRSSRHLRSHSSEEDLIQTVNDLEIEESSDLIKDNSDAALEEQKPGRLHNFSRKLTSLEIPEREELLKSLESESLTADPNGNNVSADPLVADGYKPADEKLQKNLFENQEDNEVEDIPEEAILQRINSKKGMESYQLGRQLSCKWTTGAGPRIGCVRDYPSELQFRALEQVNLSPRRIAHSRSINTFSQKMCTPMGFSGETAATVASAKPEKGILMQRSLPNSITQSLQCWKDINDSSR